MSDAPDNGAEPGFPNPIFIGGASRSGTTAMGNLVAALDRYATLGVEARFHVANEGLTELLAGNTDLDTFTENVLGKWWSRGIQGERGLREIATRDQLEAAVDAFRAGYGADPVAAGRELMRTLLDPVARQRGAPAWVDVSGFNVRGGPMLRRMFPRAKVIHMVRDGRAVVASILLKRDQTDDRETAFEHWLRRVRLSHEGTRAMPPGSALTIELDSLTALARDRELERLIAFLEIDDAEPLRRHFEATISAERAHVGAWRERVAPADARWLNRRYRRAVRALRREGIDYIPAP